MTKMDITSRVLREKFLNFFKSKKHAIIPGASLVPENDSSVLFTPAGMQPLVPYLLGERHPAGRRLVDVQKCLRTDDIDKIGDTIHHTFFEMIGNWSLGDYFKKESIEWSYEFLTGKEWLGLDSKKLAISIFKGDKDAPKDGESKKVWLDLGFPEERIKSLPKENNWWGPVAETGPCGPDTEIFYWIGKGETPKEFNPKDEENWSEIWNNVFMEYEKLANGKFKTLKQKNVDTGMGLERTLAVINGLGDDYETDLFWPIIEKIEEMSRRKYEKNKKEFRIIADHLKAAVMILGDEKGITPSNLGRGYVLRRLIRRAIRYGKIVRIEKNLTSPIAERTIGIYKDIYPEVEKNKKFIFQELIKEEEKFGKTIKEGEKKLMLFIEKQGKSFFEKKGEWSWLVRRYKYEDLAETIFDLYQSYGFPFELTFEELKSEKIHFDEKMLMDFVQKQMKKHQELSRTASKGMFKGGLAGASDKTKKLHTATHLLHQALREVLGKQVRQKGSNIIPERLRFDFSFERKITAEELKKIEEIVNKEIKKDLLIKREVMSYEKAVKAGALAFFRERYPKEVSVYLVGDFSKEICAGPHASRTGELGHFKIIKEESSGAGIRRIRGVLE